jgi:hypothetical protein
MIVVKSAKLGCPQHTKYGGPLYLQVEEKQLCLIPTYVYA